MNGIRDADVEHAGVVYCYLYSFNSGGVEKKFFKSKWMESELNIETRLVGRAFHVLQTLGVVKHYGGKGNGSTWRWMRWI